MYFKEIKRKTWFLKMSPFIYQYISFLIYHILNIQYWAKSRVHTKYHSFNIIKSSRSSYSYYLLIINDGTGYVWSHNPEIYLETKLKHLIQPIIQSLHSFTHSFIQYVLTELLLSVSTKDKAINKRHGAYSFSFYMIVEKTKTNNKTFKYITKNVKLWKK